MIDQELSVALERATRALQGDDAVAARAALHEASVACEEALLHGLHLEHADVGILGALHARCSAVADRARERIAAALGATGDARRAEAAYRR